MSFLCTSVWDGTSVDVSCVCVCVWYMHVSVYYMHVCYNTIQHAHNVT